MRDAVSYLKMLGVAHVTPEAARCAELLERWVGLHHLPSRRLRQADWTSDHHVEIVLDGTLDSYDSDLMTILVFLAHDLAVRVEISGRRGPRMALSLLMHPRVREGHGWARHPTLEEVVGRWAKHPERHVVGQAEIVQRKATVVGR